MVNVSIDVTDLGGEARPGDKVVFWRPRMGGSATHAGRVISTAPVTVFLTDGKATVSDVEPGEMTVLLQCRGVESQGPVTVGVPDGDHTVTLRALLESQFEYAPPIVSAVQEAASNASASEEAAIQAQIRSEAAADRAEDRVDEAINNGANLVRNEVKQDADRAVSARQAATQSESNAAASENAAASSASNAKTSETNAKQSETNAGDYAAVATTAATEAVDAMERATDLAGGDFATHEYVDTAAAETKWARPPLTSTSVLNNLSPGLYPVSSASVATELDLPGDTIGYLTVIWVDPGGVYRRFVWETDTANAHFEWRATYWNGNRGAWYRPLSEALETVWKGTNLTADSPVDALPAPGRYNSMAGPVSTALGLPEGTIGVLDETWPGSSNYRRQDWKIDPGTGHRHYRRRAYLGVWQPWVLIAEEKTIPQVEELESRVTTLETATPPEGGDGSEQDSWALTRVVREADMRRRVGRVSVPGGAVTLIFDHGTTKFRDIVWPALQARGLPATLALCHDVHVQEPRPTTGFDTATVAQIKSWVAGGLDIANHSATHNGATGWAAMHAEIIGAQKSLETTLGTTVDNWVQPGYPWDHPDFDGFSRGYTSSAFRDTVAGRMIVGHHVAISGKIGALTDLYELDGQPPIGFQRVNIDNLANMAEADSQIQAAITGRKRVAVLCHPYLIAADDSTSETSTKESDFLAFLDRLVAERDAGRLSVLTLSQWAVAERS